MDAMPFIRYESLSAWQIAYIPSDFGLLLDGNDLCQAIRKGKQET